MVTYVRGSGDAGFSGCTLIERLSYILRRSAMLHRLIDMRRSSDSPVALTATAAAPVAGGLSAALSALPPLLPLSEFSDSERLLSKTCTDRG